MGGEEVKIKCPECGGMYPQQDCGHQGLKLATLRAENVRLKADNLDLINNLEGEGYRLERLQARIAELVAALKYVEWRGPNGLCPCCPVYSDPATKTHSPYCQLAAALKGDADDEG